MSKSPPRDLVRFTPGQFSLAVAVTILLAAGGFVAGYMWGVRTERIRSSVTIPATVILPSLDQATPVSSMMSSTAGTGPNLTFYSELTDTVKRPNTAPSKPSSSGNGPGPREKTATRAVTGAAKPGLPEKTIPAARTQGVMVQLASYPAPAPAQELKSALEREGYPCEIQEADLGPRGRWYRVRLGPFSGEEQARQVIVRMEKEKSFKGYIVPR